MTSLPSIKNRVEQGAVPLSDVEFLLAIVEKLPRTADGEVIIPGVSKVWINPNSGGFPHNEHYFDDESQPIEIRIAAWHGDHVFFDAPCAAFEEGDYWFGKLYSSREAALKSLTPLQGETE